MSDKRVITRPPSTAAVFRKPAGSSLDRALKSPVYSVRFLARKRLRTGCFGGARGEIDVKKCGLLIFSAGNGINLTVSVVIEELCKL